MDEKNYEKANEVAREIDYKIKTTINYIDLPFYIYIYKRRQDGDLQGCESAEVSMDRNGKLFRISKISLSELNIALSSKKNLFIDARKHHLTKEQFKALESIKENAENKLQNVKEKYKDFLKIELPFKLTCISDIMRPAGKNDFEHLVEKNDYKWFRFLS